jgi:VanZ family protein
MATLKYFASYWLPVLVYCLVIFIQSSLPAPDSISKIAHFDKLLHFAAYSVLGALFYRAFFTTRFGKSELKTALVSIFAASLYGLSDEIHQAFVPSRTPDIRDVLADSLGALAGVLAFWKWSSRGKAR